MPAAVDATMIVPQIEQQPKTKIVRVAAAQIEPVPFDLDANVAKVCNLILEAGQKGVQLIGFAECAIPGYPYWIWYMNTPFCRRPIPTSVTSHARCRKP